MTEVGERIEAAGRVTIARGGAARELPPTGQDPASIARLAVRTAEHGETTVEQVLQRTDARSLVVVHRGRLAYEWYGSTGAAERRCRCYSVTKSFTGTLAALAVHDGVLDRSSRIGDLLPELDATGFAEATVGDAADMTVAIAYDEDYDEVGSPASTGRRLGFGDYAIALGLEPDGAPAPATAPRSLRALLAVVGPDGRHGEAFAYATPVTDVLTWLLERARGRPYVELLTSQLWSHVGAQHDAILSLDSTGLPVAAAGLGVTTRDLARFGLLLAEQATPKDDTGADPAVPSTVLEAIRDGGDPEVFQRGAHYAYLAGYSYRDQWWLPGGSGRPLSAWGIHGQFLWVDPDAELVVACHCGGPDASDPRRDLEQDALCRALTDASTTWS